MQQRKKSFDRITRTRNVTSEEIEKGFYSFFFYCIDMIIDKEILKRKNSCIKGVVGGQKKEKSCSENEQDSITRG